MKKEKDEVLLRQLRDAIKKSWGRDTCHFKSLWDEVDLPDSAGHCRVVALIVNDHFGGEILYSHVVGNLKWDHYWNKIPSGKDVDLTGDQFSKDTKFVKSRAVSRRQVLSSRRTQRGYKLLSGKVKRLISG